MNLCIDIGNSYIKLAIFDKNRKVQLHKYYDRLYIRDLDKLIEKYKISHAIVSTVRSTRSSFLSYLERTLHTINLSHKTEIPFRNLYKTPKTLGRDRIAGIAGAFSLYKKKNCLVVDIGTCATFDFIDSNADYHGGNISPGVRMRLRAMDEFTSNLPLAIMKTPKSLLGKTTKEALTNGAVLGLAHEIESYIGHLRTTYGKINVILTGGDASFFAELIDYQIFVDPILVLKGLNEILIFNS